MCSAGLCAVGRVKCPLQEHLLAFDERDVLGVVRHELAREGNLCSAHRLGASDVEHVVLAALRRVVLRLRQRIAVRINERRVSFSINPTLLNDQNLKNKTINNKNTNIKQKRN